MLSGINAENGGLPLGRGTCEDIAAQGFQMVRVSATQSEKPWTPLPDAQLVPLVQQIADAGMIPLVIVRDGATVRRVPPMAWIEHGNEPDLGNRFGWPDVQSYIKAMWTTITVATELGMPCFVGVVSNLNKRGLKYLEKLPWSEIPHGVGASTHWYPHTSDPTCGHDGRTRDEEVAKLKSIVGVRSLGVSEVGFHTAEGQTEEQVTASFRHERSFWTRHGFTFCCAYQINDAPGSTEPDGNYGFRSAVDGSWKPRTRVFTGVDL